EAAGGWEGAGAATPARREEPDQEGGAGADRQLAGVTRDQRGEDGRGRERDEPGSTLAAREPATRHHIERAGREDDHADDRVRPAELAAEEAAGDPAGGDHERATAEEQARLKVGEPDGDADAGRFPCRRSPLQGSHGVLHRTRCRDSGEGIAEEGAQVALAPQWTVTGPGSTGHRATRRRSPPPLPPG